MKIIIGLTIGLLSLYANADEWKSCNITNVLASTKATAVALGKIEKKISFFKKPNYVYITIFFDGKTWSETELITTGRRQMTDGTPFMGYADKTNSIIVQEFEATNTLMVTVRGESEFTMFASCN